MVWTESEHWNFPQNLKLFRAGTGAQLLCKGKHGLEREALRVLPDGSLSLAPHPRSIGDKFTHPNITTDFSESQLEFITPPFETIEETYHYLGQIHAFVARNLGNERLWPASMPCRLPKEQQIPIARYGDAPDAMVKEIYRRGLELRYGKIIQMVCGIHYNFSLSPEFWHFLHETLGQGEELQDFINAGYCAMVRNFLRLRWLFVYLYGASPVVDESYTTKALQSLQLIAPQTYGLPYATSLRMSHFGYSNEEQRNFRICYNSLERYITDLRRALNMPDSRYESYGVFRDGRQIQLNANVLQIENEYYAPIRFKSLPAPGESPLDALQRAGVSYIEVRASDLNPYNPLGLESGRLYFLHLLLLYCLLRHSDTCSRQEREEQINGNERLIALQGRQSGLKIAFCNKSMGMGEAAQMFLDDMEQIAHILDHTLGTERYGQCIVTARQRILNPGMTLSGMMMKQLHKSQGSFVEYAATLANEYHEFYGQIRIDPDCYELIERGSEPKK